jgi:hypothetical protein
MYIGLVSKTWNEPDGFGGKVAADTADSEFQSEKEYNFKIYN